MSRLTAALFLSGALMVWQPILTNAGPSLITVEPPEDMNAVLHNPDMGWVLYENYPIDQEPHGSSTIVTLPQDTFPEVDTVAIMFSWRDVETNQDLYDFSKVDLAYDYWAERGKNIQLRLSSESLMIGTSKDPNAGGGVPDYVLARLNDDEKQTRRMDDRMYVVADSRNRFYRARLSAFLRAVNQHFDRARPVNLLDLRGFGAWGEWHSGFRYADLKTRRAALRGILELWSQALPQHTLALSYSYDPDSPAELHAGPYQKFDASFTTNYADFLRYSAFDRALTMKNITYRRDGCGGAVHSNERRLNEEGFFKFHRAPLFGEFLGGYGSVKQGGSNWVSWMVDDALSLHPNYLNLIGWQAEDARNFARERPDLITRGLLQMGYRLVPTQVQYPETLKAGRSFEVRSRWTNRAVGRALRDYNLTFLLVNAEGTKVAESAPQALRTSQFLKGSTYETDQRVLFRQAIPGDYRLAMVLRDPSTRRTIALPLKRQGPRGSYLIGTVRVAGM